ncbi:hypothetical protein [Paenibacillus silvae]|nr:hypothetical protein [Paenibacillus silvae]
MEQNQGLIQSSLLEVEFQGKPLGTDVAMFRVMLYDETGQKKE